MQQQIQRDTPKQAGSHRARQLQHNKAEGGRSGAEVLTGGSAVRAPWNIQRVLSCLSRPRSNSLQACFPISVLPY
jgi:hypothetical protein